MDLYQWLCVFVLAILAYFGVTTLLERSPAPPVRSAAPPPASRPGCGCNPLLLVLVLMVLAAAVFLGPALLKAGTVSLPRLPVGLLSQQALVKGVQAQSAASAPTDESILGSPTVTAAFMDHVLVDYGSPAPELGQTLYQLGVQYGIDPIWALAFFHHESDFGRRGVAVLTHSLGNIRCNAAWRGACDPTGQYRSYPNWEAGAADWFKLMHEVYIPRGLVSIQSIIPVYAPTGDGNNVNAFVQAVLTDVITWRSGKYEP